MNVSLPPPHFHLPLKALLGCRKISRGEQFGYFRECAVKSVLRKYALRQTGSGRLTGAILSIPR